jgi:hypothetical protein
MLLPPSLAGECREIPQFCGGALFHAALQSRPSSRPDRPDSLSWWQIARPMPFEPPVTTAALPEKSYETGMIHSRRPSASAEKNAMLKPGRVDIINPQIRPVECSLNRL